MAWRATLPPRCVLGGRGAEPSPFSPGRAVRAPRTARPLVGLQRLGRWLQVQRQILDNGGWELLEVTGKPRFQRERLQEEGHTELPPGRRARQESLLLWG